jgi:hypothetical protein
VVVVPALALLFTLVQRNLVEETERPAYDGGAAGGAAGIGHSAG